MKVAIVNYGMGNLGSVRRALKDLGTDGYIADQPAALSDANRIVLPGVGAFSEGMARLRDAGWCEPLRKLVNEGPPLWGICLGIHILASEGEEGGDNEALAHIPGRIRRLDVLGCDRRLPHVGWNEVAFTRTDGLFARIPDRSDCYFVHSYAYDSTEGGSVIATTDYGFAVPAAVRTRNVFGTQFHPEKSSKAGRQLLRNFLQYSPC